MSILVAAQDAAITCGCSGATLDRWAEPWVANPEGRSDARSGSPSGPAPGTLIRTEKNAGQTGGHLLRKGLTALRCEPEKGERLVHQKGVLPASAEVSAGVQPLDQAAMNDMRLS